MNIRDLEYFVAVGELKSFSKAAARCFISQPTLSNQIKKLEEHLEVQLLERSNKRVFLTEIGEQILISARDILGKCATIEEIAKTANDPFVGRLSVGAFPTVAPYVLPSILPELKKRFPKVTWILVEEKTDVLIDKLKKGEVDCCLLADPVFEESLCRDKLFDDYFYLAVPQDHELSKKAFVIPKDLEGNKLILLNEGHCLREQSLAFCKDAKVGEDDYRASSLETLRMMVSAGTGITLIPQSAKTHANDLIAYIPFEEPVPKRTISMFRRKISSRETLIKEISSLIQTVWGEGYIYSKELSPLKIEDRKA